MVLPPYPAAAARCAAARVVDGHVVGNVHLPDATATPFRPLIMIVSRCPDHPWSAPSVRAYHFLGFSG